MSYDHARDDSQGVKTNTIIISCEIADNLEELQ
jgi:hypothetical protein